MLAAARLAVAGAADAVEAAHEIAMCVVPALADWTSIHLFEPSGSIRRVALVHRDPLRSSSGAWLIDSTDDVFADSEPFLRAFSTGRPLVIADVADRDYSPALPADHQRRLLYDQLGITDSVIVPLIFAGTPVASLNMSVGVSGRRFSESDADLFADLAEAIAEPLAVVAARPPDERIALKRIRRQAAAAAISQLGLAARPLADLERDALTFVQSTLDTDWVAVCDTQTGDGLPVVRAEIGFAPPGALGQSPPSLTADRLAVLDRAADRASSIHASIRSRGLPVGLVSCSSVTQDAFSAEDVQFMLSVAAVLGAAQERASTEDELGRAWAEAEKERDRLSFLAEASALLGSSLDVRVTLTRVAHLTVPRIADWCSIELKDHDDPVVAHVDPAKVELARSLRERYPQDPDAQTGAAGVMASGLPELYTEIPDVLLAASARDAEHLRLLRELRLESAMIVPLLARGRTLGAITLIGAESGRRFEERDLQFAMELARRSALAIDNAVLFRQQAETAATLQRSLLPPTIPEIPFLEVATLYRHAGHHEGDAIGGDFYDVYEGPDGAWHFCMGDACGKGTDAASITGLVRHTLRALAVRETSPAEVLTQLNDACLGQIDEGRFCTVVYARIEPEAGRAKVTLASGGHPSPLIIRASGAAEAMRGQGLLVGALPGARYNNVEAILEAGDSLLLYTDGVTETRAGKDEFGEDRLMTLAQSCAGMAPAGLLEVIETGVSSFAPGPPHDDVALLAVQVRPG